MSCKMPTTRHTYYVAPSVCATEDYRTKQVTITGTLGIAPDDHTVIEYPIHIWRFGYWNKGTTRKMMAEVKRELLAECVHIGYQIRDFTEPLKMHAFWER